MVTLLITIQTSNMTRVFAIWAGHFRGWFILATVLFFILFLFPTFLASLPVSGGNFRIWNPRFRYLFTVILAKQLFCWHWWSFSQILVIWLNFYGRLELFFYGVTLWSPIFPNSHIFKVIIIYLLNPLHSFIGSFQSWCKIDIFQQYHHLHMACRQQRRVITSKRILPW